MPKFQAGDTVRCVKKDHGYLLTNGDRVDVRVGDELKVTWSAPAFFKTKKAEGFYTSNFELVSRRSHKKKPKATPAPDAATTDRKPGEFRVGDRVRVTGVTDIEIGKTGTVVDADPVCLTIDRDDGNGWSAPELGTSDGYWGSLLTRSSSSRRPSTSGPPLWRRSVP